MNLSYKSYGIGILSNLIDVIMVLFGIWFNDRNKGTTYLKSIVI